MQVRNGWLEVPYTGHDMSTIEIGTGSPLEWRPAFLDFDDTGRRVAKVRAQPGPTMVRLRVDGAETMIGTIR